MSFLLTWKARRDSLNLPLTKISNETSLGIKRTNCEKSAVFLAKALSHLAFK